MLDLMTASPTGQMSSDNVHLNSNEIMGVSEGSGHTAASMWQNTCINGHAMMQDEMYCNVCGMPRASTVSPQGFMQWPRQNG
jgi:hypothetical protein